MLISRSVTAAAHLLDSYLFWFGAGLGPGAQRAGGRWIQRWFLSRSRPASSMATTIPMKIEPKTFFANERTFLSWLHMAVTIGSIGAALLGFSGAATQDPAAHAVRLPAHTSLQACFLEVLLRVSQRSASREAGSNLVGKIYLIIQ